MRLKVIGLQLAFLGLLLAGWEWAASTGALDPEFVPPPSRVLPEMVSLARNASFLENALATSLRVAIAFVIAAPIALAAGFLLGENRKIGDALAPLLNVALAVPQSIFLPIFILVLGLGFLQKVAFGVTHVFFVVAVTTMAAVRQVPLSYVEATRTFGGDRWRIYRSIYLPAMAPQVMTGLRLGLVFDIIGILLAEMYGSNDGVGVLIYRWGEAYQSVELMAGILLVSVATITINELLRLWEMRLNRWQLRR